MKYFALAGRKLPLLSTILILMAVAALTPPVFAMTIAPATLELSGDPGQTLIGEIELYNEEAETKTLYSSFENFEPREENGTPHFIGGNEGLATWIQTEPQVTLASNERRKIAFSISIPRDAVPGGHYAGIFWGTRTPEAAEDGQMIEGKLGMLLLLRVNGQIKEKGQLWQFSTKDHQNFFSALPVSFVSRFNNSGNDRLVPKGTIEIKNSSGTTVATLPVNDNGGNVLPSSVRKFEVVWGEEWQKTGQEAQEPGFFEMAEQQWNEFHFGQYTAILTLSWGTINPQTVTAEFSFFMFPWQLLLIIAVVVVIIGILITVVLKKYNHLLIAKSKRPRKKE